MLDILSETSPCFGFSMVDNNSRYSTLGVIAWNLLPFSRGNVKITVISLASVYCYSFHVNLSPEHGPIQATSGQRQLFQC